MAIYRSIQLSFWTDNKVEDEFTPEDKYFYLYLMTNPQTNLCGCYEVSYSQLTNQTGYSKDTIDRLLLRFQEVHKIIKWNKTNKEILLLNWHKYNWSTSEKTVKGVESVAQHIKTKEFKKYVLSTLKKYDKDGAYMGHTMGHTYPMEASVTDSIYISNNILEENNKDKELLEELERNFKIIYDSYPKKRGRTDAFKRYKAWVTNGRKVNGKNVKLTNRQIWDAIALYKKQMEDKETDLQFYKNFDTFMGDSILDYVMESET